MNPNCPTVTVSATNRGAVVGTLVNGITAARSLGVSRQTVRRLIESGQLRGFHAGRIIRVTRDSVERLLAGPAQDRPSEDLGAP